MPEENIVNLEEQVLLLESVFESSSIAMMILDKEGRIIRMNKCQEEQSKVNSERMIGTFFHESWSRLMEQQNYDEHYWKLLKYRTPFSIVFHDVKPQFFDLTVSGITYGVPLSYNEGFLLINDVSANTRTDKKTLDLLNLQLSQNSIFLRNLLDSSPNAIITIDGNGNIQTTNKTAEKFFGHTKGDLLWQPISILLLEPIEKTRIIQLSQSKSSLTIQCRRKDGSTFPAKIKLTLIQSASNEQATYLVTFEDQTYESAIEAVLAGRLKLEVILSELFATFINAQPHEVDDKIGFALSRIGQQLDIDRCHLTQYKAEVNKYLVTHSWAKNGIKPAPLGIDQSSFPWLYEMLKEKKTVQISKLKEIPREATVDLSYGIEYQTKSLLYLPLIFEHQPVGGLGMEQVRYERTWDHELVLRIKIISEVLLNVLQKRKSEKELQQAFQQIKQFKDRLEIERNYLLDEIKLEHNFEEIIGQSQSLQKTLRDVEEVAPTNTTVLIMGETGTGKELLARAIHSKSNRKDCPLVKVNCASLPVNLIESELFGHEKGSFTGAYSRRKGRFETADGATLFLDEIGELPLETQAKLLRVLQENEFERLGSSQTIKVDIRIIAATNRNLEREINAGRFRKDLWYRLNVFPIKAPPLNNRKGDIPLLVNWMVKKISKQTGKMIKSISLDTIRSLEEYHWPGNVRELQNVIERAVIKSRDHVLDIADDLVPKQLQISAETLIQTLAETEKAYFLNILKKTNWTINGKTGAAAISGLAPSTLRSKMKKLSIKRP